MAGRSPLSDRGIGEWALRGLAAAIVAVWGYVAVSHTAAYTMRNSDADSAYGLAPYDGRIGAVAAAALSGSQARPGDRSRADAIATDALRRDPTAALASSTLGLNAEVRGDERAAHRHFGYAETLSRRDIQTQLWTIEDSVKRGDIAATLRHYDIALRVAPTLSDLFYPVLIPASADPDISQRLFALLVRRPPWGQHFVDNLSAKTTTPRETAALLRALRRARIPVSDAADANIVNALLARDRTDEAWTYFVSVRPGVDRRTSRNPGFLRTTSIPSQLDWNVLTPDAKGAAVEGGRFDFALDAGTTGPLLAQTLLLPPGNYRFGGRGGATGGATAPRPYWHLTCRDSRELIRMPLPIEDASNQAFGIRFSVPLGCTNQSLQLVMPPANQEYGASGRIESAGVTPL